MHADHSLPVPAAMPARLTQTRRAVLALGVALSGGVALSTHAAQATADVRASAALVDEVTNAAPPESAAQARARLRALRQQAQASGRVPLADPTRPPAFAMPVLPATHAATGTGAAVRAMPAPAAAPSAPQPTPVLQAVHLPAHGSASAVVDGRLVQVGDRVNDRLVMAIDRQGLELQAAAPVADAIGGPTQTAPMAGANQRLWLLGQAAKQPPGSITITRSATFVPSAESADSAGEPLAPLPERSAANPPSNTALSLAGSKSR